MKGAQVERMRGFPKDDDDDGNGIQRQEESFTLSPRLQDPAKTVRAKKERGNQRSGQGRAEEKNPGAGAPKHQAPKEGTVHRL